MNKTMTKDRFEMIVAAYGADPRRWPADEREAAQDFAAAHAVDLSQARALDALLDDAIGETPSSELLNARILRAARHSLTARAAPRRFASPSAALAASLALGILFGYGLGASAPPGEEIDVLLTASLDAPVADWPGVDG